MLVQIRDRAALSSLPSTNLRHYLKTHGWEDAGRWGKRATVHTKKYGGRKWEILIPLSDTVADYAESMAESIAILSTVEERSQLDVFYDILKAGPGEVQELVKAVNKEKKRAKEALQKVRQNPAVFPLDRAISEADSLQRGGKIEEAIEKWRSIANVSEGIDNELAAHAWFSVGYLLTEGDVEVAKKNNIQEAISVYDRALSLKSDFADAYTNRGTAKAMLGQLEAAIADFDQALSLHPDDAEVYYNRGSVGFDLGDYEAVIADFDRAIHLKPDYIEAYSYRGIVKSVIKQSEAAIADFNQAIDLNPDYAEAYYNRGLLKRVFGDYEAVIADFDRAIHLKPDLAKAYSHRGIARGNIGDHEAAIADFDRAIRLNPDYAEAYCNRGTANDILDRKAEARADFETALDLANRSGNTDLKSRIERQLQVIKDTVSTNDSVRKTKDWLRSPPVYDSVGETRFDFDSPVVTKPSIQRALVEQ